MALRSELSQILSQISQRIKDFLFRGEKGRGPKKERERIDKTRRHRQTQTGIAKHRQNQTQTDTDRHRQTNADRHG